MLAKITKMLHTMKEYEEEKPLAWNSDMILLFAIDASQQPWVWRKS